MMTSQRLVYQVSELTAVARNKLEQQFPAIWVEGEISNFSCPSSGHWYFSLKDENAQIRTACFRFANQRLGFRPGSGERVLVRGKISLYEPRGDFQLIADYLEPAGEGALRRAFEKLKQKLAEEGMFAEENKQAIPDVPQHVVVITSPTGAVVRDILSVLKRRFPAIAVTIIPAQVQGQQAAGSIVNAISVAESGTADVIIIARGGGSLEDLQPFNEEIVARAVYACSKPLISAVGHETDVTITDFAADVRAPTPSAAAELVSPDQHEWLNLFQSYRGRLVQLMEQKQIAAGQHLDYLKRRLRHPGERLQLLRKNLQSLQARLYHAWQYVLRQNREVLHLKLAKLKTVSPASSLADRRRDILQQVLAMHTAIRCSVDALGSQLARSAGALEALSPLSTLARGYCIATVTDGTILHSSDGVNPGDELHLKLMNGTVDCRVLKTEKSGS